MQTGLKISVGIVAPAIRQKGFTLVEMALFIIFFGLFAGFFVKSFLTYQESEQKNITQQNMDQANTAIINFLTVKGRYPCPARLSARPDDPDYGIETCDGTQAMPGGYDALPADKTGAIPDVNPDGANVNSLVDLDPVDASGRHPEQIMAGAIPFKTIEEATGGYDDANIAAGYESYFGDLGNQSVEKASLDAYGNKLTYIVTRELADPVYPNPGHTFHSDRGAILVVDENREVPVNFVALTPEFLVNERLVHYAIISQGPDGVGAFTREGKVVETCIMAAGEGDEDEGEDPPPATASDADERENCDVASAGELNAAINKALYNSKEVGKYDDIVFLGKYLISDLWSVVSDENTGEDKMIPLKSGDFGVGTQNPQHKLDVAGGNMRATTAVNADDFCDASNANCLNPSSISGDMDDMRCPAGQVIQSIHNNTVSCATPTISALNQLCPNTPRQQFLQGIRVNVGGATEPICFLPPP
jgi:type II secretory pathway pseudopilin PulG